MLTYQGLRGSGTPPVSRRITCSGTFSIDTTGIAIAVEPTPGGWTNAVVGQSELTLNFLGMNLSCQALGQLHVFDVFGIEMPCTISAQYLTLRSPVTSTFSAPGFPFNGVGENGGIESGTFSFALDVLEYNSIYLPADVTNILGTDFPAYGGAAQGDGLPAQGCQPYELAAIGGLISCSISFAGQTVTASTTITNTIQGGIGPLSSLPNGYALTVGNAPADESTTKVTFEISPFGYISDNPNHSYTLSMSATLMGQNWSVPGATGGGWSNYYPTGALACQCSMVGGLSLTAVCNGAGLQALPAVSVYSLAYGAFQPAIQYSLSARARYFGGPGSSQTLVVNDWASHSTSLAFSNSTSYAWSQSYYFGQTDLNGGSPTPVIVNQLAPVSAYLIPSPADDARDWRCPILGFQWNVAEITHAADVVIDPCTALTNWTAGTDCELAITDGYLTASVSGGVGNFYLTVPAASGGYLEDWEAFRYLLFSGSFDAQVYNSETSYAVGAILQDGGDYYRVIAPTTGNAPPNASYYTVFTLPETLAIDCLLEPCADNWTFNLTQAGNPTQPQIDLCCASADTSNQAPAYSGTKTYYPGELVWQSGTTYQCTAVTTGNAPPNATYWETDTEDHIDICQSRYPLSSGSSPVGGHSTSTYDMGWGVNFCQSVHLGGIPDGYVITLAGVQLTETSTPSDKISLLEPFLNFIPGWTGYTVQQYVIFQSNARPLDLPGMLNSGSAYTWPTIAQFQTWLLTFPGIAYTAWAPPSDSYHNQYLPLLNLGGEGATYNWTSRTWTDWVDAALPATVPAQDLWDEVFVYPGAGVCWATTGAYDVPTPINISKSLRGGANGIVFDSSGNAVGDIGVNLFVAATPATGEGSGTSSGSSANLGYYSTGSPWAFGNVNSETQLQSPPLPDLAYTGNVQNRQRRRTSFRRNVPPGAGWHLQDWMGRVHQAVVVSGDIWYRRSQFTVPVDSWVFFNEVTSYGDCTGARMGFEPTSGILYMLIERLTAGVYNLYLTSSIDTGASWTTPTLYMATARGGTPIETQMGGFGYCWFAYNSGSSGPGTMWGSVRDAGDSSWPTPYQFVDNTGTPIAVADGGWSNVQCAQNEQGSLTWTPTLDGQPNPSYWLSNDLGRSWTQLT